MEGTIHPIPPVAAHRTPGILVVDDNPINLEILTAMLEERGYKARPVLSGSFALLTAQNDPPDLVLLDITMPEMDGYEVCRAIKANPKLKDIPVIFTSALSETIDKVKAFAAGGVDYVTKPFQIEEVLARVDTHLRLRRLQMELQVYNENLEEIVLARTRDLARALKRLSILDNTRSDFLTLISHELRTPLNGVLGIADLVFDEISPESASEYRPHFEKARDRILAILEDASLLSELKTGDEHFRWESVSLNAILEEAIGKALPYAETRQLSFAPFADPNELVTGKKDFLVRAFHALLETAAKFAQTGGQVVTSISVEQTELKVIIEAAGKPVPPEVMGNFFEILAIGKPITVDNDLGLGPPVAQRLLTLQGGSVKLENLPVPGIRFTVRVKRSALRPTPSDVAATPLS